jgi:hypothetical protein
MNFACSAKVPNEKSYQYDESIIINSKLLPELYFSVFPNPALDRVRIEMASMLHRGFTVEIFNTVQELALAQYFPPGSEAVINVAQLASGSYLVRVSDGNSSSSRKLIKL